MPNAPTLNRTKHDQITFRLPEGTRERIENYRRAEGFRSWNAAAVDLLSRSLIEVEF